MTAAALLVVLGAALIMEAGGLSMAMGAFMAGVLLSTSTFRHQLEADVEPFRGCCSGCSSSRWACRSTSPWWRRTGGSSRSRVLAYMVLQGVRDLRRSRARSGSGNAGAASAPC